MSALAYGVLQETRKKTTRETAGTDDTPSLSTYIDIFAGLVPAEVLAAHAVILSLATESTAGDKPTAVITEEGSLQVAFWGLIVAAGFLFMIGRFLTANRKPWVWPWDLFRLLVPPTAFVGWTMVQKNTAFDAVFDWNGDGRAIIAILGAVFLAAIAGLLGVQAQRQN